MSNTRAGFGYTSTNQNLFKLANSFTEFNATTLEGLGYLFNENFKVTELELKTLKDILSKVSQVCKVKYRNASTQNLNYFLNSDFNDWDNGLIFNFDKSNIKIQTSNKWFVDTKNSVGSIFRQAFIPQNQTEVPEYPNYFLGVSVSNFDGKPILSQKILDATKFTGQTFTLSSYLRATENGIILNPIITINYGALSPNQPTVLTGASITTSSNFSRYSTIFTFPTDITSKALSDSFVEISYEIEEQGIYEMHFSSLQLELGSVATPYKNLINIESQCMYLIDTFVNPFELLLPVNSQPGDYFSVYDLKGTLNINNLTLNPNGKKILGSFNKLVLSDKNVYIAFRYIDDSNGWVIVEYKNSLNVDPGLSRISQMQSLVNSFVIA